MPDRTQRLIVTGGAGFIGSALCRQAIAVGCEVLNIDKLTYAANPSNLESIARESRYRLLKADICDANAIAAAFEQFLPDVIFHLAAESHVDRSISGPAPFINTNVVGTYTLLEAAREHMRRHPSPRFRFVHVSTDEVYGSLGDSGAFSETTPYDPSSPYSASKAAADHLAMAWYRTYGLPVVVTNCSNNYGPYHFPEKLVPLAIVNAIEGRPIDVYGDGGNVRDWLYVEDHVRGLLLAAEKGKPGHRYNLGGRNERTNIELVETLCAIIDDLLPEGRPHRRLIRFVADRPGHDRRYAIDPSRAGRELGWQASVPLEVGLRRTVEWFLLNRSWWEPLRQRYDGQPLGRVPA
jgi:dTDP-glucose 4,6-dehydratase